MKDEIRRGVLVVGHGSRRAEANEDVRAVAASIGERGGFVLVQPAYLEIEHPNIAEGFARLVERGARDITVHPYFLSPGRHTCGDIPVEVSEAASHYPGINYRITKPLSAHPLVIEASLERIAESIQLEVYDNAPGALHRGQRCRAECGTVYLVNPEVLSHVQASAERIYVGKVAGGRNTPQRQINHLLIQHARAGKRVVRLKGGDPFLFGRGGEEAEALVEAGISFEVVPGVSSALAVPAYAGIPLTHRGM